MAPTPQSSDSEDSTFDSALPLQGVVVCCTSIPVEQRAEIATRTTELGGVHKYDLTPDVTHLIVGEYDTPKYRHVAKERPDIKPMAAGWIDAICELFTAAEPINFKRLERAWRLKTFETDGGDRSGRGRLLICLTGFDDAQERQELTETITNNGGAYTGDLTKRVTHLVVHRPQGRKFVAARDWGIHTVSVEWLHHCVERGMILDESLYDPLRPPEERGLNAWNRQAQARRPAINGKRTRDASGVGKGGAQDERKTKLRRTASLKLSNQRDGLWGDILGKPAHKEPLSAHDEAPSGNARPTNVGTLARAQTEGAIHAARGNPNAMSGPPLFEPPQARPVFDSCCFYIHGYSHRQTQILVNTVVSLGGQMCNTLEALGSASSARFAQRILIVPQTSQPESHPQLPDGVDIITEFFIEKCLHKKQFFDPAHHVIGRPFPRFPIPGFESLGIATSGFAGVDLNQADKTIRQLGARYDERFTSKSSLLLCTSLEAVRKQKLDLALAWKVPVIRADWLWTCISTGFKVPFRDFMFPELGQKSLTPPRTLESRSEAAIRSRSSAVGKEKGERSKPNSADANVSIRQEPESDVAFDKVDSAAEASNSAQSDSKPDKLDETTGASNHSHTPPAPASVRPVDARSDETPPAKDKPAARVLGRIASEVADSDADDSDEDALAVATREVQARRAARDRKLKDEASRLALCSKLTSLIDGAAAAAAGSTPASADEPDPSAPARRKRKIMGRAVSNASAASNRSGSAPPDAAATLAATGETEDGAPAPDQENATAAGAAAARSSDHAGDDHAAPPATQLVYDAPHADYFMAQLRAGVAKAPPPQPHNGPEKLTLKDLQQQPPPGLSAAGRRSRRR